MVFLYFELHPNNRAVQLPEGWMWPHGNHFIGFQCKKYNKYVIKHSVVWRLGTSDLHSGFKSDQILWAIRQIFLCVWCACFIFYAVLYVFYIWCHHYFTSVSFSLPYSNIKRTKFTCEEFCYLNIEFNVIYLRRQEHQWKNLQSWCSVRWHACSPTARPSSEQKHV